MNEVMNALPETPVEEGGGLPVEIQTALDRLEATKSTLQHVRALITQATEDRTRAERDFQAVFEELASIEASAILDGSTVSNAPVKRAAQQRQQNLLTHQARIAGLRGRERAALTDLDESMRILNGAFDSWCTAQIEAARQAFIVAVDRFVDAVVEPVGLGLALGDRSLMLVAQRSIVFDLSDPQRGNAMDRLRYWKSGPTLPVVRKYAGIRASVANSLASARTAARTSQPALAAAASPVPTAR